MTGRPRIRAITFDVGGTLIEPWPSVGHIYAEVAGRHGCDGLSPAVINERFARAWRRRRRFRHGRAHWAALVDEVFAGLAPHPPSTTFFPELYDEFADAARWRVFDDVLPTLDGLAAQGLTLGVISNWDERLRGLLADLRLDRRLAPVIVSCEVGFTKPSPGIFQEALRCLGRPACDVLHIGDSPDEDFAGAIAVGMAARLLARERPFPEGSRSASPRNRSRKISAEVAERSLAKSRAHDRRRECGGAGHESRLNSLLELLPAGHPRGARAAD